ncbi:unnamed protein product, partial [Mycena citricolor]
DRTGPAESRLRCESTMKVNQNINTFTLLVISFSVCERCEGFGVDRTPVSQLSIDADPIVAEDKVDDKDIYIYSKQWCLNQYL